MRTKKRKFPDFRYRECDAFAEYLHQQSLEGWHFKEWRFGLVFEQGEPKNIEYYVEIFPKSSEQDLRPGKDTQEFAEYCEAAGWKLLDAHGKFCIFKKVEKGAVPIVEPEERFENIKKAEREKWMNHSLFAILYALFALFRFWTADFERWAFEGLMLFLIAVFVFFSVCAICEGIYLSWWKRRQEQRLKQGEAVSYGKCRIPENRLLIWCVFLFMLIRTGIEQQSGRVWFALLIFGVIGLVAVISAIWRPLEAENALFQISVLVVVLLVMTTVISLNLLGELDTQQIADNHVRTEHSKSILGEAAHGEIVIPDENHSSESRLTYDIYRSPYSWVVEKVWGIVWKKLKPASDCKEVWNAEKAYVTGGGGTYWYTVKYPDAVLEIYMESEQNLEGLNETDITVLLESLQLF